MRNSLVFNGVVPRVEDIGDLIKTRVAMWIKVKFELKVYIVDDFKGFLDGIRKIEIVIVV